MTFVLDTSVTMSWCFDDEASDDSDAILRRLTDETAIVPALWELEVSNVLALTRRRKRLTEAQSAHFAALLGSLPIDVERQPAPMSELIELATAHSLTAYDASYLWLAIRSGVAIATSDRALNDAARRAGIETLLA
ncbi:type II toxin-antitoxin system VapC family toxin [Humibacter albus]|uniref:type II toxin-antitoxin system VapC family toxin n=1 Tax=Humibacter albus TaxID=427754 RepID=UPI0003B60CDC|nr:type II toxin-antitoxin system VapC family toxin [Humibacter albus]